MKINILILLIITVVCKTSYSQSYPAFGPQINVTITGLTFDAMEPAISADGNYIFFNNINDGITTSLYYATKINDSTFTYTGALTGANQTITPRLDAVASSDSANNFFWTSTRDFPTQFDNFHHGIFNGNDIVNIGRLHGSFYIYSAGWIMMDAAINYSGNLLYYTNAYFGPSYAGCSGAPCEAKLGIAQKQNDSTFNKLSNSDSILQNVNDTNYIVYAPHITKDGLELYYTRLLKSTVNTEICVSVRNNQSAPFSLPYVIYSNNGFVPEAATLTTDKQKMYYHQKDGTGVFKIYLRYRDSSTGIDETHTNICIKLFPNPSSTILNVIVPNQNEKFEIEIYSLLGQQIFKTSNKTIIDIGNFEKGIYFITVKQNDKTVTTKIIKQ